MTQPTDNVQKADAAADLRSITTCIPGRVCGGSRIFKFAADEIERLREQLAAEESQAVAEGELYPQHLKILTVERDALRLEVERLNAVVGLATLLEKALELYADPHSDTHSQGNVAYRNLHAYRAALASSTHAERQS